MQRMRDIFDEKKTQLIKSIEKIRDKSKTAKLKANFIEMPGLFHMDRHLKLPPEIPSRNDSKEPILEYSQKRDYELLLQPNDACGISKFSYSKLNFNDFDMKNDVFLLMVVKSACGLRERRDAIRESWGNEKWVKSNYDVKIKKLFLLGACTKSDLQEKLKEESEQHDDVIQWNFFDSFRNLTLKDCLFLQWFARNCQNVPYIFKGDDDVFVNTKNIAQYLKELPNNKRKNLFLGSVLVGSPRILDPTWKYYVSYNLYPEKIYPPYVSGGGFLMSGNLAIRLFQASLSSRIFPIDDAFLGTLLKKVNVSPENDRTFKSWGMKKTDACRLAKIKTYHKVLPINLKKYWKSYINLKVNTCPKDTDDVFVTQTKR